MKAYSDISRERKSHSEANSVSQKQRGGEAVPQFGDNRNESVAQRKLQKMANAGSFAKNQTTPIQMSGGSSQANEELVKAMGKSAELVDNLPGAKPHTKKGTGSGGGTDHQARNAMVINKAKRDTMKAHDDPTMFSSSRMRGDARSKEKSAAAAEKRQEKAAATDSSLEDYEKAMIQAQTTYKGDQEGFEEYLQRRKYNFTNEQLDDLYKEIFSE